MTIDQMDRRAADHPEIMTPQQAADFLGVTTETLFRLRKEGSGPRFSRPSQRILRYLRTNLISWLKEHRS